MKSTEESLRTLLPLDYVEKDIHQWGIHQLKIHKEEFLEEVVQKVIEKLRIEFPTTKKLHEELASTLYQERIRISTSRWKSDPEDEKDFWNKIKSELIKIQKDKDWEASDRTQTESILKKILKRYANEIVGNFEPRVFKTVQKFLPYIFSFFLNSKISNYFTSFWSKKKPFYEKFKITGDFDLIRNLSKKGTIVVVPTHFSNTDSPIIGWALNSIGLEAVTYGAGINLFGTQPLSFLMGNLGAYKIDRRKKNKIYLEILKTYSQIAIQKGTPSLFFPGGTRSRSGSLESKLKLGLLSTAVEAQQENFIQDGKKIFIVPVVINYHFNVEASSLVQQHLKEEGKEKFVSENFEYSSTYKILKFIKQISTSNTELVISFGKPMDALGHNVDMEGQSISPSGKSFDIKGYYEIENKIVRDEQRNFEYTKILGGKIVESFRKYNTVLSSPLVCFVLFQMIQKKHRKLSFFELLLLPKDDRIIDFNEYINNLRIIKEKLIEFKEQEKLLLSETIESEDLEAILKNGIENVNLFSSKKIIFLDSEGNLNSEDLKLLYFYHNRLKGYGLEKFI